MARNLAVAINLRSPPGTGEWWTGGIWHSPPKKQELLPVLKLRVYTETATTLFTSVTSKTLKKTNSNNKYGILYS